MIVWLIKFIISLKIVEWVDWVLTIGVMRGLVFENGSKFVVAET